MSTTTPVPRATFNRISNRIQTVWPELDLSRTQGNTAYLPADAFCGVTPPLTQRADDLTVARCRSCEGHDVVYYVGYPIAPVEVFVEIRASSVAGSADTDRLIDRRELEAFLPEDGTDTEYEWDEYPEPLWDPLKSEVRLLIREYFEQADADTD